MEYKQKRSDGATQSAMPCDPLTKIGSEKFFERLENFLQESVCDKPATPESVLKKIEALKARQAQKEPMAELKAEFENKSGQEFDVEAYKAIHEYYVRVDNES